MTDYSIPPTDEDVVDAFKEFITERAAAGVLVAKAVSDVSTADGQVRVVL